MDGKRSGLFGEIPRLAQELRSPFIFLENVPGLRTRGLDRVVGELSSRRYDCRWRMLSAADVGAPHIRKRWFLLAYNPGFGRKEGGTWAAFRPRLIESSSCGGDVSDPNRIDIRLQPGGSSRTDREETTRPRNDGESKPMADTTRKGLEIGIDSNEKEQQTPFGRGWWESEPSMGRVAYGCPHRVDRITALGNGVVPLQAREAFESMMFKYGEILARDS
ncbi:DNA cytosine methyltransferase [Oligoflexus sp.]|uniref:DNA cytosine methyltransferase n=1 Tax=Oligoflexus sp. TaxID=1971216 RepID=UPI0039C95A4A